MYLGTAEKHQERRGLRWSKSVGVGWTFCEPPRHIAELVIHANITPTGRSKYMPHQGNRECARRAKAV